MKSTSHFAMAHLLYASLEKRGIYLNRIAFVYGNIAPDYTPAMLVNPHFSKVCNKEITEITACLSQTALDSSGRVGADYSRQLGFLCHFLCDYFCFAHNKEFAGGIKQHRKYEDELDAYLRHNYLRLFDMDGKKQLRLHPSHGLLLRSCERFKEKYLAEGFTLENDLSYSFQACVSAILSLLAMSAKVVDSSVEITLDDLIASLKGYATGNCLTFHMFFFKNRHNDIFFVPELMPPIRA
ncbi:MAG: zinc dependent phospholipase C family protein [Oscillospiraceae bacterium]